MNVVLDTNVIVSAVISPKGPPAQIFGAWRAQAFALVTSPDLLAEVQRTLSYDRIRRYLPWSDDELLEFVSQLRRVATVVTPTQTVDVVRRDHADNRVLEAAAVGEAEYVVSGDHDLLDVGTHQGIRIVTPARFLAVLAAS